MKKLNRFFPFQVDMGSEPTDDPSEPVLSSVAVSQELSKIHVTGTQKAVSGDRDEHSGMDPVRHRLCQSETEPRGRDFRQIDRVRKKLPRFFLEETGNFEYVSDEKSHSTVFRISCCRIGIVSIREKIRLDQGWRPAGV